MSTELPAHKIDEDFNPYAPPEAPLELEPVELTSISDLAAAEAIRKAYIRHEASIKSIGLLHFLGASFGILATAAMLFIALTAESPGGAATRGIMVGVAVFYLAMSGLHLALGIGLRRLQSWARWTDAILAALALSVYGLAVIASITMSGDASLVIAFLFGSLILGYVLYLLLSKKAGTIFSADYKSIIAQTPHIRCRTSLLLKILLGLLVALIVFAVLVALITGRPR